MGSIPSAVIATDFQGYTMVHYNGVVKYDNESLNKEIKNKAVEITKKNSTSLSKCMAIFNWVQKNIKYDYYTDSQKGAVKTLESGEGNCCDQTRLQIALVESLNLTDVQAYYVHSEVQYYSKNKSLGHVWALYSINGTLEPADTVNRNNKFGKASKNFKMLETPVIDKELWM
jgi:Transglutaminase-like enzymes, putative cysteine proteases